MTDWKRFSAIAATALLAFILAVPVFAAEVTVNLVAEQVDVTMADGAVVPMWGLRDAGTAPGTATVPGPTISAVAGDNLVINLINNLIEPTSLVINGQKATEPNAMVPTWTNNSTGNRTSLTQRVRSFTHETPVSSTPPVSVTYRWDGLKPGTYLIESGSHQAVQVPMGLYAALKVDVAAGSQAYPATAYNSDVVLLFSEVDPALNAAVAAGQYGTAAYTTSMGMGYLPRYFLINGASYVPGVSTPIQAGNVNATTLLRFLNAGSRTRNPVLQGPYMTLVAEDGYPLPYPLQQYSIYLPAGKTMDAIFNPVAEGTLPLYDRSLGLVNNLNSPGGMVTYLTVGPSVPAPASYELGVFRTTGPDAGHWYLDTSGDGAWDSAADTAYTSFGLATDLPLRGDWNGDGASQIGVFRDGTWILDADGNGAWDAGTDTLYDSFGTAGDLPVTGVWNGGGATQVGVYRAGAWFLDTNGNGAWDGAIDTMFPSFGAAGDIPVTGDWNGDGTTQIGVFRDGEWYLDSDGNGAWDGAIDTRYASFGTAGDIPVTGDWNGDGATQIGVFRDGTWILDADGNGAWDPGVDTVYSSFGTAGDLPVVGK